MTGLKTNEVAGTRAVLRHYRMSAYKARQVLDLVRGKDVDRAEELLRTTPREGARVVGKVLASAVANARNNDQLDPEELYVSACYADEGTTLKRWRPRARGRATRIRKRTCHITVIVSRLPDDRLERRRARQAAGATAMRSRRVAASRRRGGEPADQATAAGPLDVEGDVEEDLADESVGMEDAEGTDDAVDDDAVSESDDDAVDDEADDEDDDAVGEADDAAVGEAGDDAVDDVDDEVDGEGATDEAGGDAGEKD